MQKTTIIVAGSFLLSSMGAFPDSTAAARKQIQAAYDKENIAASKKDTSGVMANLAPDYVSTNYRGQTTTAEAMRQRLPVLFSMAMSIKAKTMITKLTLTGSKADVLTKEHAELIMMNPRTRKPSKLVVDETAQTLWVKNAGNWKKKKSRTLTAKQTMDGKPVQPPPGK